VSRPCNGNAGDQGGYVRCSTSGQDLTAQRDALTALGVDSARVYVDTVLPVPTANAPGSAKPSLRPHR